ncbi:MAG: DUF2147 domain-containing protein [Hyphomicrobiaceae bacterium]|nr:DUF2147 domain-containing protein [Hyphomicrobiaceae bacterium]
MLSHFLRPAAAILFALSTIPAAFAGDVSPAGNWQSTGGEARYKVSLCGDGTQLCARLTWLSPEMRTDQNLAYLNKLVINRAELSGSNVWEGTVVYEGEEIDGSVKLVSSDLLKVSGCRLVLCQSLVFQRI